MSAEEIKVLLVDDHRIVREGVRRVLAAQPGICVVGEAANSQTAFELVRTVGPDVIIMDVRLVGEDGVEASARIRSAFPGTRILVLSSDTSLATVKRAMQAGVSGYLTKNGSSEELVTAIREVMDHRLFFSPEVASVVAEDYMKIMVSQSAPAKPVLTERERLLLRLVAEGKRNKDIAGVLGVGVKSVDTYRSRLMRKLKCGSPAELTRYAIQEGISSL